MGKESQQILTAADRILANLGDVSHYKGATVKLLERPVGATVLTLIAEVGAWRMRLGDQTALGDEAVSNGTFATDTLWTKGTGWTIAAGKAASDGTQAGNSDLEQAADDLGEALVEGEFYTVVFTVTNRSAGNVRAVIGGTAGTNRASNATFTETLQAGSDGKVILRADLDFVGEVDDVSVKRAIMTYVATPAASALNGTGTLPLAAAAKLEISAPENLTVIGVDANAVLTVMYS